VVRARIPLFQSGDAPSRCPHRSHDSTAQTLSTFIPQYVIYTHSTSYLISKLFGEKKTDILPKSTAILNSTTSLPDSF
jgi:hypothetical protein